MGDRYGDYSKGSSRSTRDDSRTYQEVERDRSRSRSRSPRRHSPVPQSSQYAPERSSISRERDSNNEVSDKSYNKHSNEWEDSDEEVPSPPPPPRITKISMGFSKPKDSIKITLGGVPKPSTSAKRPAVASVFNTDDDDEPEEMPAEARMRMRNIGRETPTSAGPNSFGKTKQGFCDAKKVFEKNMKQALESNMDKPMTKFPQTIYKIKGP